MSSPRKFRVWDGEEMHEPPDAGSQSMPPKHFTICAGGVPRKVTQRPKGQTTTNKIKGVVLFSTGLTDAEGAEIYEGDIVEHWSHDHSVRVEDPPEGHSRIGLIRYVDAHWWVDFTDPGKMFLPDISHKDSTTQVIGNRYEDPSLLERT